MRRLKTQLGDEEMKKILMVGECCYLNVWLSRHKNDNPTYLRAYHEYIAADIRSDRGNRAATKYMQEHGYNDFNWR